MSRLGTKAALEEFQELEFRLRAAGLYSGPIDDDWGQGVNEAIDRLFAKAGFAAATPLDKAFSRLPPGYEWLSSVQQLPRTISAALPLLGTLELAGSANSPVIMDWANETGLRNVYTADKVPWCGLFMALVIKRAGYEIPQGPLWALNWAKFGVSTGQPGLGDVVSFTRDGGGHVALYVGEDKGHYHILGGNQSDRVSISRIEKKRLHAARRPNFKVAQPASVRPYILTVGGAVSRNEA
ncbi:MAG: TIGR02594 family protein [Pseudomonadota bacterium]